MIQHNPLSFGEVFRARFLARPNRFLVRCESEALGRIEAFMPNPGRMRELLLPDTPLYLTRRAGDAPQRKTEYTVLAAERLGAPVLLHTGLANAVARHLIEAGQVPGLEDTRVVRAEIPVGRSRFDFLLEDARGKIYVEVKSCTLFANGVAMFPDAVTARGRRHLLELAALTREGVRSAVIFVVHHGKQRWFMPDYHTDPAFSEALVSVRGQVAVLPMSVSWTRNLRLGKTARLLEIPWEHIAREAADRGAYILVMWLDKARRIAVGGLGVLDFAPGYYLYVGSAMANLEKRVARHLRTRKRMHWHIDYLRAAADAAEAYPIRASARMECEIAAALAGTYSAGPLGFGASDCGCNTHLFHAPMEPANDERFHGVLEQFRMRRP